MAPAAGQAKSKKTELPIVRRVDAAEIAARIAEHERALDVGVAEEEQLSARLIVLQRENAHHRDVLARLRDRPTMTITEALRIFLAERGPSTTREAVQWLRTRGHTTGATSFYHSVHAALRAMADVVGLVKQGEVTKFALKEGLKVPKGWHRVEFPRRTSAASRRGQ